MKLSELQNRRLALISEMPENSVAILSSANRNYRTRDVENPYRQDSDFLYINGLSEPNLVSIIYKENNEPKTVLFRDNTSEHEKIWEGNRLDNNDIKKLYVADDGGFSYFIGKSQTHYYGVEITKGLNSADIHSTTLCIWSLIMILDTLEMKNSKMNIIKP